MRNRSISRPLRRLLLGMLLLLLALSAASSSAASMAGRQNRREFMGLVTDAFVKEDYDALEATAAELREKKDRFPDGVWTLPAFYDALELRSIPLSAAQDYRERLARWQAAQPRSVTVRVVKANALQSAAWDDVSAALAQGKDRFALARAELEDAEKLTPAPGPDWFNAMLKLAVRQSWAREEADRLYARAVAAEPGYLSLYFNRAIYLRSYGREGEWEAFALEAGRKNASGEGMGLYSRIAWSLADGYDDDYLSKHTAIQWPLMREGFQELDRRWPGSEWNLNCFCRFACLAGDRETARELFARIGDNWTTNWLSRAAFKNWQSWAGGTEIQAAAPARRLVLKDEGKALMPWSLRFAPDGASLYAGYDGGLLVRWDVGSGTAQWRGRLGEEGSVNALAISPDGRWLAAGTAARMRRPNVRGKIGLWDLRARQPDAAPTRELEDSLSGVHGIGFSPEGGMLAAWGYNQVNHVFGEIRLWSLPDWKEIRHDAERPFPVMGLVFLPPESRRLAFVSAQGFKVVETATWARVFWPEEQLHAASVRALALAPDGKTLACATADGFADRDRPGEIAFWNTEDWTRRTAPHVGSAGGLGALVYSADGRWLLGGGYDGILRAWDTASGKAVASWQPEPGAGKINAVAFAPDAHSAAAVREDGAVSVYAFSPPEAGR